MTVPIELIDQAYRLKADNFEIQSNRNKET